MKQAELSRRERQIYRNIELWKPIEDFPDYEISNMGRVKSLGRFIKGKKNSKHWHAERILKQKVGTGGYHEVAVYGKNKKKDKLVHLLVIEHFGEPKPSPKHECNHADGDKSNNWNINLEWMTSKQNIKHAMDTGLRDNKGQNNGSAKLTEVDVKEIRRLYLTGKYSYKLLGKKFNIAYGIIGSIVRRESWQHIEEVY